MFANQRSVASHILKQWIIYREPVGIKIGPILKRTSILVLEKNGVLLRLK